MKILVIAPSWIGDVVMSQTLYKQLQDIYANCQIYVLAPKWCIDVLSRMPEVYQTITMPIGHGEFNLKKRYQIGKGLKAYNFDKAYILPNSWKSALIPLFAKIPDRYGFKGESRYLVINHLRTNKQDFPLLVERYCSLAFEINKVKKAQDLPKIAIPSLITHALSKEELTAFNITSTKLLGICPGAEYGPAKKWPPKYYAKVIDEFLTDFPDGQALIFGSQKDLTTANEILAHLSDTAKKNTIVLTGKTSLTQAIDLLSLCAMVICNDSGLMHIAAAVNCKVVAIFGSTSTNYTPPQTSKAIIIESNEPCHPCFKRECKLNTYQCLTNLKPQDVITKIKDTWGSF